MSPEEKKHPLTMCWFGFYQPYATSIVHVPEQEITPNEIDTEDLIFIWNKFMKEDLLTALLKTPVPWSPALIEGYERKWEKRENRSYKCDLIKKGSGKCLGAVILLSRVKEDELKPLIDDYEKKGYTLKMFDVLIGDMKRNIRAFLP